MSFLDEETFKKILIVSHAAKTTGLELREEEGSLYLGATKGNVQGAFYRVQPLISATSANRPSYIPYEKVRVCLMKPRKAYLVEWCFLGGCHRCSSINSTFRVVIFLK